MSEIAGYEEIEDVVIDYIDGLESPDEKIQAVDEFIRRLNFVRRLLLLTSEELEHLFDESLSPNAKAALEKDKPGSPAFEERLNMYTRAIYFKRCAWNDYLNGITDTKPFCSK